MPPFVIPALIMVACGVMMSAQAPTNAMLGRAVGSPVNAAFLSIALSLLTMTVAVVFSRARPDMAAVRTLPWYAWTGGLYGASYVLAMIVCAPLLGLAPAMTLLVAGQVAAAVVIDHFGLFGLPREPVTLWKLAGVAMVVGGMLVARRT